MAAFQGAAAAGKLHDLGTQSAAPLSAAGLHLVHHSGDDAPLLEVLPPPCHGVSLAGSCLAIPANMQSGCSSRLIIRSGTRQAPDAASRTDEQHRLHSCGLERCLATMTCSLQTHGPAMFDSRHDCCIDALQDVLNEVFCTCLRCHGIV